MYLVGAWCGAVLLLFAWLGYYAFPIADDLFYAMSVKEKGLPQFLASLYMEGSGRYVSNIFFGLFGLIVHNLTLYHFTALFHVGILVFSVFALVSVCHGGSRASAWLITLCLASTFLSGLPSPSQGLYWQCGSLVYFIPFNATFGAAAVLGIAAFSPGNLKTWHCALLFCLLVVIMGSNEITAVACLFFLGLAWLLALRKKHPKTRFFGYAVVVGLVLLLLSFGAPGNFARAADITEQHSRPWQWKFLINSLGGSLEGYKWLVRTPFLPSLVFCLLLFKPRWNTTFAGPSLPKRLALAFALGCLLFFGEYLLVYVTSKRAPYARIMNAIYDGSFLFFLACAGFFMRDMQHAVSRGIQRFGVKKMTAAAGILVVAATLAQPTISAAVYNLAAGEFAAYRSVWLRRLAMIPPRPLGNDMILDLPALRSRPFPLVFRDLEEKEAKHQFIAEDFARYHGLKGIRIVPYETPSRAVEQK